MAKKAFALLAIWCVVLCFVLPVGVAEAQETQVYLGGVPLGFRLVEEGLVVQGLAPIGADSPAGRAGVQTGDVLVRVDDNVVHTVYDVQRALDASHAVQLHLLREGDPISLEVTPRSDTDGVRRLGLYLTEGLQGVGTLTYVTCDTATYGALGHGVEDARGLAPVAQGYIYRCAITAVVRGQRGTPGELVGQREDEVLGTVQRNTYKGVFGEAYANLYADRPTVSVGSRSAVHTGDAVIVCTTLGGSPAYYAVTIDAVNRRDEVKGITLTVTDSRLLAATGGIVQGMSGSPILQDGHLVGAVTHVTVDDPRMGYGIFIDSMMAA